MPEDEVRLVLEAAEALVGNSCRPCENSESDYKRAILLALCISEETTLLMKQLVNSEYCSLP